MYLLNWCLTLIFFAFAYLSLFWQADLLNSRLGHFLLGFIALFWFFRFILQFFYFGFTNLKSNLFAFLLLLGGLMYAYLALSI